MSTTLNIVNKDLRHAVFENGVHLVKTNMSLRKLNLVDNVMRLRESFKQEEPSNTPRDVSNVHPDEDHCFRLRDKQDQPQQKHSKLKN